MACLMLVTCSAYDCQLFCSPVNSCKQDKLLSLESEKTRHDAPSRVVYSTVSITEMRNEIRVQRNDTEYSVGELQKPKRQ